MNPTIPVHSTLLKHRFLAHRPFCRLALLLLWLAATSRLMGQTYSFNVAVPPYSVVGSQTSIGTANTANVAVDSKDSVYYPNFYTNTIYKIDTQGNQTLVPTTGLNSPQGMRFDASDNLYICDASNSRIVVLTPAGVQSVLPMTGLLQPQHLAFDAGYQNLYVSDRYAGILQYNLASQKTVVYATNLFRPEGIAVDAQNNVYYGDGGTLLKNRAMFSTSAGEPDALLFDLAGNLYVMASNGDGLHRIDTAGTIFAMADDGSNDIAIDSHGVLYMPSHNGQHMFAYRPGPAIWGGRNDAFVGGRIYYNYANTIRTYYSTPSGITLTSLTIPTAGSPYGGDNAPSCFTSTVCGANMSLGAFLPGPQPGYALATFSDGTTTTTPLYGSGLQVEMGFSPGKTTQIATGVRYYGGAANDLNGNVYVSDNQDARVLKITGTTITTVPFTGIREPLEVAVDGTNAVYVHDNFVGAQRIVKLDASGKQTVAFDMNQQDASLPSITYLGSFAVDGATNLYVAGVLQDGKTAVIERFGANGVSSVYATPPSSVSAMAFDTFGTLYAAEVGTLVKYDHFANRVPVASVVYKVFSLAIEPSGTVYFTDYGHATLMQIPPGGTATNYPVPGDYLGGVVTIDNYGNLTLGDNSSKLLTFNDRTTQPYAFGSVGVGASSTLHYSLVNVGSVNGLTVSSITGGGPFTVDSGTTTCVPATTNLVAGGTCDIGFTFTPTNALSYSNTGQVVIPLPTPFYSATVANLPLSGAGVKASPVANTGGPYSGTAGVPASFNGSASNDPNNEALTYAWNFGDNTNGTGATPTHTYAAAGTYTVTLMVTNADGVANSATTTATIAQSSTPTATPAALVLNFAPAVLAATPTASQTLTASFTVTGYAGTFLPTAVLHYGLSYSLGAVSCTGGSTETCTVPVTFKPLYPGSRRDAIFLMNGSTRLATMLLSGVGQGPLSLLGPGVLTTPHTDGNLYFYQSVVDDSGTAYVISSAQSVVTSVTAAGVATQLSMPVDRPLSIAIDGAGVLYVSDSSSRPYAGAPIIDIKTYDTVTGAQVSMTNASSGLITALALGDNGQLYETNQESIFELSEYGGAAKTFPISPDPLQTTGFVVDSNENLFLGGDYGQNELKPDGTQIQINQTQADYGYVIDAADTLYVGRFSRTENVGMLPAYNGWSAGIGPDLAPNTSPLGLGIGGDGTLWVGNYNSLDKVDRSQGAFIFDATNPGQLADPQTAYVYNGGNQPLVLTSFALSGDANYTISSPASGVACTTGDSIPAGGLCALVVNFTAPGHGGIFNGTLTFTTNSLNTTTNQIVTLSDAVNGPYLIPSPTSLIFGGQAVNTASAAMNVTFTNNGYNASGSITSTKSSNSVFAAGALPSACNSIIVGNSCTVGVTFTPATSGSTSGTVTFSGNGPDAVVNVTGGVNARAVTLSPASYDFGSVGVGNSTTTQVTLTNTGVAAITISHVVLAPESTNSYSYSTTCGTTLASGVSCVYTVIFKPTGPGASGTTLNIADDAGTQTSSITGNGLPPTASLTPATYNFGNIVAGSMASQLFTLTNTSAVTLSVGSVQLAAESTKSYSASNNCSTLAAGAACSIVVTFTPNSQSTSGYTSSTTLSIIDAAGTQTAIISGSAITTPLAINAANFDFGSVPVGSQVSHSFTVTNLSSQPVTYNVLTGPPTSTAQVVSLSGCASPIAANATCLLTVTFQPTGVGFASAGFELNPSTGIGTILVLNGTGIAPLTISSSSFDFGKVPVGSRASHVFTITNLANQPTAYNVLTGPPSSPAPIISLTGCASPIAANASCSLTATYQPTGTGFATASFELNTLSAGGIVVVLNGTGTAPVRSEVMVIGRNSSLSTFPTDVSTKPASSNGGGIGVAIDSSGNVFSIDTTGASITKFTDAGVVDSTLSGGGLNTATALAVDGVGKLWVANSNGTLSIFDTYTGSSTNAVALTTSAIITKPTSVSIDASGSVWISNAGNNTVTEVIGVASPAPVIVNGVISAAPGVLP